jgi:hypothetical protein
MNEIPPISALALRDRTPETATSPAPSGLSLDRTRAPDAELRVLDRREFPAHGKSQATSRVVEAFRPAHLDLTYLPAFKKENAIGRFRGGGDGGQHVFTVKAPDRRYTYSDSSFPWCTIGRVKTGPRICVGTMVGPRHMLMCTRVLWPTGGNTMLPVEFSPSYYFGPGPFGVASVERAYAWRSVDLVSIRLDDIAEDYAVCVLNSRMGELTGWMGIRTYNAAWDGPPHWALVTYPRVFGNSEQPAYQDQISFRSQTPPTAVGGLDIEHDGDVEDTWWEFSGPFFGWWDSEPWPCVVGLQSAVVGGGPPAPNPNPQRPDYAYPWGSAWAAGGQRMLDLIAFVRAQHP